MNIEGEKSGYAERLVSRNYFLCFTTVQYNQQTKLWLVNNFRYKFKADLPFFGLGLLFCLLKEIPVKAQAYSHLRRAAVAVIINHHSTIQTKNFQADKIKARPIKDGV